MVRSFRAQAPNARLVAQPLGPQYDYELALQDGAIDIVIGNWPEPPEHLHSSTLLEDEIVCLMAGDHPWAASGELTAERYLRGRARGAHALFDRPARRGGVEPGAPCA